MIHRHLDYDSGTPLLERGRAALDDVLDRGDLDDWVPLARAVASDPRGRLAGDVLAICEAHPMYGTSRLWSGWITRLRQSQPPPSGSIGATLAALRVRRGLRQVDVAARLGASQPDVSRIESRGDIRLSTFRAYVNATGGRISCRAVYPDGQVELTVEGPPSPDG